MAGLIRMITRDGGVVCSAIDAKDIVEAAHGIHHTTSTASAALGRLLAAGALMGKNLKNTEDSLTLRLAGGGPAGSLIVVADGLGNVRGYLQNPEADLPSNARGKLDVSGLVGKDGYLSVIKDLGYAEPYIGQIPIASGEIAEDITAYYALSEQIPTICALGVLVNPDLHIRAAGGFLAQLLPGASSEVIERLEENLSGLPPVTTMLDEGETPRSICQRVLAGFEVEILDQATPEYRCGCSRERVEKALRSLQPADLEEMIAAEDATTVDCHFCGKQYAFSQKDLEKLLAEKKG